MTIEIVYDLRESFHSYGTHFCSINNVKVGTIIDGIKFHHRKTLFDRQLYVLLALACQLSRSFDMTGKQCITHIMANVRSPIVCF